MKTGTPMPGPRGDRSWWDSGPCEPPEPHGPDPIWRGLLIAVGVTFLLASGIALRVCKLAAGRPQ